MASESIIYTADSMGIRTTVAPEALFPPPAVSHRASIPIEIPMHSGWTDSNAAQAEFTCTTVPVRSEFAAHIRAKTEANILPALPPNMLLM